MESARAGSSTDVGASTYTVVEAKEPFGLCDKDGNGRTCVKDWQEDALGHMGDKAVGCFGPDAEDDAVDLQL